MRVTLSFQDAGTERPGVTVGPSCEVVGRASGAWREHSVFLVGPLSHPTCGASGVCHVGVHY